MSNPRAFPCPYCKGRGIWIEPVLDDGSGPEYDCGACGGKGMIGIGSAEHQALRNANPPKEIMWEMLAERDLALKEVISALKELGIDGWSDAPHLLNICQSALDFPGDRK